MTARARSAPVRPVAPLRALIVGGNSLVKTPDRKACHHSRRKVANIVGTRLHRRMTIRNATMARKLAERARAR